MSLKILWVHQEATLPSEPGPERSFQLMRQMALRGHQPVILASGINRLTRRSGPEPDMVETSHEGVQFLRIQGPSYQGNSLSRIRNLVHFGFAVRNLTQDHPVHRPDLIVGSSPFPTAAWGAASLARRWRCPFILEMRDFWPDTLVEVGGLSRKNPVVWALNRLQRSLYRQAAAVITPLWGAEGHVRSFGGACPVHLLMNGCIPGPPPEALPSGPFTLMYAGALNTANDLATIGTALQLLKPELLGGALRVVFIGDGPGRSELEKRLSPLGVSFRGAVAHRELPSHLAEAHGFIAAVRDLAIYREGLGLNKLFDYMAAGRPTIFAAPGTLDPVSKSHSGLRVSPENPMELASAIRNLMALPLGNRIKMGLQGRDHLESHHNFEVFGKTLEAILLEAAANRGFAK